MLLSWKCGSPSKWSSRTLQPELLEHAGPEYADRNLRELAVSIGGSEAIELYSG